MLDLLIRNGSVIDGTGRPSRRADVALANGRIVAVGEVNESATHVIDATDRVVCPGFVDLHTHYDPHVMWDGGVTPSSLHGVTSVVGGNCGFTIAPISEEAAEYVVPMLARVEGMPLASLEACLDLEWSSFGSWLSRLDGRLAVNAGFMVGHSTLRRLVMGPDAVGHTANLNQIADMIRLLHQSMDEGALGFSSSHGPAHSDHHGDPVPSRWADFDELVALSGVVGDHKGTMLEFIPSSTRAFGPEDVKTMIAMSRAAGRSLNWNLLTVVPGEGERERRQGLLSVADQAVAAGATVRALTLPVPPAARLSFFTGFAYDGIPGWNEVFKLPPAERLVALQDPGTRDRMRRGALEHRMMKQLTDWKNCLIADVASPALSSLVGRRVGDIAAERGGDSFDTLLDIVVADGLQTGVRPGFPDTTELWSQRLELWRDGRAILGGSDAGAHLDMLSTFSMHTTFLAEAVRRWQLLPLEEAIFRITDVPARFYGLTGRGRVAPGWWADLVVFDPGMVGPGTTEFRADLPAGGQRLYSEPTGIEVTIVNGVVTSRSGQLTGDTPGTVLRSGIDTETVAVP